MNKFIAIALTAVLASAAFVGCSKNPQTPSDASPGTQAESGEVSGSITFLTNRTDLVEDGTYAGYLEQFQQQYPDVTVEFEGVTDYAGELATRMQTTQYGDVLMIPDAVPNKEFGKFFLPFGSAEELGEKYREDYLYSKWYDGQVYGLAYLCTVEGLVYNKAVFEQAGITELPKSSEEFLEALQKIKDNTDAIPYYTNANSGWPLDQWESHTYGTLTGDANYKENVLPFDKDAFSETGSHYAVAKLLHDIVAQGLCEADPTTGDWEASKVMLNNGEVGCMLLGNWALQQIKDAGDTPENVGYMPYPATLDGKQYATSSTDYCYAINVNSENIPAAKAWVAFMVEESGLALASGGISLLKDDPMPEGLENFVDTEFVVNRPASDENLGLRDEVEHQSGITLYDNGARLSNVVDIARGASRETFEEYMQELNENWSAAVQ